VSLHVVSQAALGLSEISAFAVREADGARELLCVGDRDHDLLAIPLGDGAALGEEARHDLRPLVDGPGASGFEGLACDGAGLVLILQEGQCRVIVLGPGLARLEAAIELAVARDQRGFGREWAEDENARGEGLLLMQRGHLLVAKQKEPVCLIEFGPPGDAPLGIAPGSLLGPRDELALTRRREGPVRYEVLAWWRLSRPSAKRIESANDLALDEEGGILLVSSRSRRIARIAPALDPAAHEAAVEDDWRVPALRGEGRRRPEALCVVPGAVLVGYDARAAGDNLVVLEPLG
jgi:hypothetical protein